MAATVLITGASGGLGASLARHYSRPGSHLVLWGRDEARLRATSSACEASGATVDVTSLDLRDHRLAIQTLEHADRVRPIEIAIFNAGVGGAAPGGAIEAPDRAWNVAEVNFTSVAVLATAIGALMQKRRRGHIAIVGSVADVFPLPMAPAYSGSKAGIAMFARSLDLRLRDDGVAVTLVSPGFIDTAMSRSLTTPKPFMIGAEQAAFLIAKAIGRRSRHVIFPWQMALLYHLSRWMPPALTRRVLKRY